MKPPIYRHTEGQPDIELFNSNLSLYNKYFSRSYPMKKDNPKNKIKRHKITFSFESSDAKEVILMGDFNNWNPKKHPMKKDNNGKWTKAVLLLPGQYEYKFLVDGKWKQDPQNDRIRPNRFGTYNNVFNLMKR
jgi:5'-AMP-activated protein kinase regulatory beta subunit